MRFYVWCLAWTCLGCVHQQRGQCALPCLEKTLVHQPTQGVHETTRCRSACPANLSRRPNQAYVRCADHVGLGMCVVACQCSGELASPRQLRPCVVRCAYRCVASQHIQPYPRIVMVDFHGVVRRLPMLPVVEGRPRSRLPCLCSGNGGNGQTCR
jgi:hypothetical protein